MKKQTTLLIAIIVIGISSTLTAQNWQLIIPSSAYDGNMLGLSSNAYDRSANKIYSLLVSNVGSSLYSFDLNNNTVSDVTTSDDPSELYSFTLNADNSRIMAARAGTDVIYSISTNGGSWTNQQSGGAFDSYHYGANYYFNQVNNSVGFFGGYGFYSVNNAVYENDGTQWIEMLPNNSNCNNTVPPKRVGEATSLGAPNSNEFYFMSGAGNCSGDQFASSCDLGSAWASDIGVWCWLKDLWKYNYDANEFTQILPVNSSSITQEGDLAYDYCNNTFYMIGGYIPSPVFDPSYNPNFNSNVYRYRVGIDNGFVPIQINGAAPPILPISNMKQHKAYFDIFNNIIIWIRFDGVYTFDVDECGLGMNENGSNSLELYPNPSSDQITIKTDEVLTGKVFEVYDQVGKLILKGTLTGTKTSFQLNGIANGMYSIQIEDLAKRIFIVN